MSEWIPVGHPLTAVKFRMPAAVKLYGGLEIGLIDQSKEKPALFLSLITLDSTRVISVLLRDTVTIEVA